MANPTGKGGFSRGRSGNPLGRPRKLITGFGLRCRQLSDLCIETLEEVARKGSYRERMLAVGMILDRGLGRPPQSVDVLTARRHVSELSDAQLDELDARVAAAGAIDDAELLDGGSSNGHT
jgi:hypothetical protein